jgi:DNA-binding NtrC family response regulator
MAQTPARTRTTFVGHQPVKLAFSRYKLEVLDGPEKGFAASLADRLALLGSDPDGTVPLSDPMVSRRHARVEVDEQGYRLDDLDSKNGTFLDGRRVRSVYLAPGDVLTLGRVRVRFDVLREEVEVGLSAATQLEGLLGESRAMRELFALVEKVAPTDATVLVEGETGTGKEGVAEALHKRSGRTGPLGVFDCSAVAAELVESELFGHLKGAFTGADRDRPGAFRAAEGGTLFLDEIGELPDALQPKLLRVLEKREVKPVGSDRAVPVKVRVVAATHRALGREVEAGRFRADLYYRLAVVKVRVPPLRERLDDLPLLVRHFLGPHAQRISYEAMAKLKQHPWPGNVRELKNFVTRAVAVAEGDLLRAGPMETVASAPAPSGAPASVDTTRPFKEAKDALVVDFERRYWTELLSRCNDNLSEAARVAGIHRKSAEYVVQKLGLRRKDD